MFTYNLSRSLFQRPRPPSQQRYLKISSQRVIMPSTRDLEAAAALVDMSTQFVPTKVRLRLNTPRPSQAVFTAPTLRSGLTLPMHPDEQAQDVSLNDSQASERPRKRAHGELDDEPSTSAYAGQMPKAGASISANSKHPGTPTTRQPLKGLVGAS